MKPIGAQPFPCIFELKHVPRVAPGHLPTWNNLMLNCTKEPKACNLSARCRMVANTIEKQAKATGEHIINLTEAYTRQLVTLIKSSTTETMKKMLGLLAKANTNTLTNLTNPTNNEWKKKRGQFLKN